MNEYKVLVQLTTEHMAYVSAPNAEVAAEEARRMALAGDAIELGLEKEVSKTIVLEWSVAHEPA